MKPSTRSPISLAQVLAILSISLAGGYLAAQDTDADIETLTSGPAADTVLTPVPCYATSGALVGQEFDAAAKLGSGPGALLFVHELTRNTAPVIRGLDNLAAEYALVGFRSFTIMLSGDRTAGESQLKRVNGSLRMANPMVLSVDGAEGPGNYALNRKCTLTLVLIKGGAVHQSMALTDVGPGDVPKIRGWIEELTGKIPQDEADLRKLVAGRLPSDGDALRELAADQAIELRRLRAQLANLRQQRARQPATQRPRMRKDQRPDGAGSEPPARQRPAPNTKRVGKPPEDAKLNTLLRSFIRQTNEAERADSVYADIVARAGESDELKAEAVEMFKLMLSFRDRYGTAHAQGLAEGFLREHAAPTPATPPSPTPKGDE